MKPLTMTDAEWTWLCHLCDDIPTLTHLRALQELLRQVRTEIEALHTQVAERDAALTAADVMRREYGTRIVAQNTMTLPGQSEHLRSPMLALITYDRARKAVTR